MQDFLRHINSKNKKFKCYLNSDESETLSLTVDLHNEFNQGATNEEISLITKLITDKNEQIVAFYKLHNGIKLYCNGDTSGLQFYSIGDLKAKYFMMTMTEVTTQPLVKPLTIFFLKS